MRSHSVLDVMEVHQHVIMAEVRQKSKVRNSQYWLLEQSKESKGRQWNDEKLSNEDPENVGPGDDDAAGAGGGAHVDELNDGDLQNTSGCETSGNDAENLVGQASLAQVEASGDDGHQDKHDSSDVSRSDCVVEQIQFF